MIINIKQELDDINLTPDNSVVIGSGILSALKLRVSNDIDVVVTEKEYGRLKATEIFQIGTNHIGTEIITTEKFEIGTQWRVLNKDYKFNDLLKESIVIDGVRYITLKFLLSVKSSWLNDDDVRQKDISDVKLIREYLQRL